MISPRLTPDIRNKCIQACRDHPSHPDEAMVVFTTGTSSIYPKGVLLSHDNIMCHMDMLRRHVPERLLNSQDRTIPLLPWTHCYGLLGECFSVLDRMGSMRVCRRLTELPYHIHMYKPTILFVVPKMIEKILEYDRRMRSILSKETRKQMWFGSQIRYLVSGGAALSEQSLRETRDHLGLSVYQGYGCTEMSPMITLQTEENDNNVGTLLPDIEIMFGQDQEILVRGPNRFMGYLGENLLDRDIFYHTGDAGYMDDKHRLHITGRLSAIVKLSNGRFVNLNQLEQDIQKTVAAPLCLWDHEGRIHGAVVRPTPHQWHKLIADYKWIEWHQRPHDFSMADGTLTLKGEVSRRMVQKQCS